MLGRINKVKKKNPMYLAPKNVISSFLLINEVKDFEKY